MAVNCATPAGEEVSVKRMGVPGGGSSLPPYLLQDGCLAFFTSDYRVSAVTDLFTLHKSDPENNFENVESINKEEMNRILMI